MPHVATKEAAPKIHHGPLVDDAMEGLVIFSDDIRDEAGLCAGPDDAVHQLGGAFM